jgi:hypothetical protein
MKEAKCCLQCLNNNCIEAVNNNCIEADWMLSENMFPWL